MDADDYRTTFEKTTNHTTSCTDVLEYIQDSVDQGFLTKADLANILRFAKQLAERRRVEP